jgi:hypothetical protein
VISVRLAVAATVFRISLKSTRLSHPKLSISFGISTIFTVAVVALD